MTQILVRLDARRSDPYCGQRMEHKEYRLAAIMVTDVAGFSTVLERDEAGALELLQEYNRLVADAVAEHGGRVIRSAGDVFMCEFPNTVNAVRCGVRTQELVAERNRTAATPFSLRIGIHLGDTYFYENDAIGEGVTIAGRLQSAARPGRVCISQDVRSLIATKLQLQVEPLGQVSVSGAGRSVDAYEIVPADERPSEGHADRQVHGPGDRPASAQGVRSTLQSNLGRPEYADFNELKALVLQEIKRAGRRLSVEDIRRRVPRRGESVDRALESLADKGFLTRVNHD